MNTPLQTSTPSFVYHRIPTKVSRKDFNQYIEPHLKRPKTGPKPKLSLYKIFNYILQIPPDFVVKSQAIDVAEVILALIRQLNLVSTLWRNRQSRRKRLSISEVHGSTTKADGM